MQKILAQAGVGSRRACEELIADGRVSVNGKRTTLGDRAVAEADRIELDGVVVPVAPGLRYLLLNKPAGVVTTVSDPDGRPTVMDLIPKEDRLFPVGRLDVETEGLVVLTNDGALANLLTHPSHGIEKVYLAEVTGRLEKSAVAKLARGVELDDGVTAPAAVRVLGKIEGRKIFEIRIHEGRNRQVRRMLESVGGKVVRLARIGIGDITDRSLKPGKWRLLKPAEIRSLYQVGTEADSAGTQSKRGRKRR